MALTRRHHSDDVLANCRQCCRPEGHHRAFLGKPIYPFFEFLNVKWYTMFFVLPFRPLRRRPVCVSCHLAHVVPPGGNTVRVHCTRSRLIPRGRMLLHALVLPLRVWSPALRSTSKDNTNAQSAWATEICIAAAIALGDAACGFFDEIKPFDERFSGAATCGIVGVVVGGICHCSIGLLRDSPYGPAIVRFARFEGKQPTERYADADARVRSTRFR